MKRILACVLAASVLVLMLNALNVSHTNVSADSVLVNDDDSVSQTDQEALYRELFDPNSVIDIAVNISKKQISILQTDLESYRLNHSRSSVYRICDDITFTVNGRKYVVEDVGVRLKGTSSRSNFFNDILGIYNLVNFRIGFNCTFDSVKDYGDETHVWHDRKDLKKRQNRTFATMKTLELKWNIMADNTYVRNQYVQGIFKDYGVPAQNCTLCTLSLGGTKLGLFRLFESVDEDFIHRYFPEEDWDGDLYKVRCTRYSPATYSLGNTYGIGDKKESEEYNFDLKTNLETSNHESIRNLLQVINRTNASKEDLESVMDMDELARVLAINFAVGNQDDMRTNYNNHYIYFRKSDGKGVIIPYDNELVLGDTYVWSPSRSSMTTLSPYFEYNYRFEAPQESTIIRQTVLRNGYYNDLYTEYLRGIVNSRWFTVQNYLNYYNTAKNNYSDKLISRYNYISTFNQNIEFSMEGGENYNGNMSIAEYMETMKANILENIE